MVKLWPGDAGYAEMALQLLLGSLDEADDGGQADLRGNPQGNLDSQQRSSQQQLLQEGEARRRQRRERGVRSLRPPSGAAPPSIASMPSAMAPGVAARMRRRFDAALSSVEDEGLARKIVAQAMREPQAAGPLAAVGPPPSPIRQPSPAPVAFGADRAGADAGQRALDAEAEAEAARAAAARRRAMLRSAYGGARVPEGAPRRTASSAPDGQAGRRTGGEGSAGGEASTSTTAAASPKGGDPRRTDDEAAAGGGAHSARRATASQRAAQQRLKAAAKGLMPAEPSAARGNRLFASRVAWGAPAQAGAQSSARAGARARASTAAGAASRAPGGSRGAAEPRMRARTAGDDDALLQLLRAADAKGISSAATAHAPVTSPRFRGAEDQRLAAGVGGGAARRRASFGRGQPAQAAGARLVSTSGGEPQAGGVARWSRDGPPGVGASAGGRVGVPSHAARSFFPRSGGGDSVGVAAAGGGGGGGGGTRGSAGPFR